MTFVLCPLSLMSRIERGYKFCDFSLNSTRYKKICCLNDFSVRCAENYNFRWAFPATPNLAAFVNFVTFAILVTLDRAALAGARYTK